MQLGGYYSDIARAARRRDARIENMRQRQALGKRISEANLARLEEQQAREEALRQQELSLLMTIIEQHETLMKQQMLGNLHLLVMMIL